MKIVSMVCPNCGASLQVDADQKNLTCNYCGNSLYVDDEVKHVQYDNSEETGYQFEKGRQRAQAEAYGMRQTVGTNMNQPPKKRKTWLWVLGWIFIFPVPLTILMVRNQKLSKPVKIGIIAAAWIVYLFIGFAGGGSSNDTNSADKNSETVAVKQSTEETTSTENTAEDITTGTNEAAMSVDAVSKFVEDINKSGEIDLEFVEDFVPSDRNGGHYRTEFRLNAWKDSTGKSYKYDDTTVDIILSSKGAIQRIYMDGASLEQCESMIRYASPLLDSTVTDSDIQETIDYVEEQKEANGYYYGKLGLLMLGHGDRGYEFMLK